MLGRLGAADPGSPSARIPPREARGWTGRGGAGGAIPEGDETAEPGRRVRSPAGRGHVPGAQPQARGQGWSPTGRQALRSRAQAPGALRPHPTPPGGFSGPVCRGTTRNSDSVSTPKWGGSARDKTRCPAPLGCDLTGRGGPAQPYFGSSGKGGPGPGVLGSGKGSQHPRGESPVPRPGGGARRRPAGGAWVAKGWSGRRQPRRVSPGTVQKEQFIQLGMETGRRPQRLFIEFMCQELCWLQVLARKD